MPFFVYAWIASISSAFVVITTKLTSKHAIANPWLFNFLSLFTLLLFIVPVAIFNQADLPNDWLPIILAAFFGALWYGCYIFALYKLDVSSLASLFSFRTIFAVFIGILFLNEALTITQALWSFVIIGAGIFASVDEKFNLKSFFQPAVGVGLVAMLFLAANNAFIKTALVHNSLWTTNLWVAIITQILLVPTIPLFRSELLHLKFRQITPLGALGIFQLITTFAANSAYAVNVGITSLIMATPVSMILAFLFSIFAPQLLEKHTLKVYAIRFTAAIIMIFGALQLSR
ncbi:DMT family transporter [Candidatus Microgenomates bacterium]|nr:MAG: DMT family transporter [Candidatus Microgenomates bacterium]